MHLVSSSLTAPTSSWDLSPNSTAGPMAFNFFQVVVYRTDSPVRTIDASTAGTSTAGSAVTVFASSSSVFCYASSGEDWIHDVPAPEERRRTVLSRRRSEARRLSAEAKAEDLLRSCLSRDQDEDLTRHGWFDVPVAGRTYRVKRGTAGNVFLLEGGKAVERFCIHPRGVPAADAMLAQKLLLESDERKFRAIANITPLR